MQRHNLYACPAGAYFCSCKSRQNTVKGDRFPLDEPLSVACSAGYERCRSIVRTAHRYAPKVAAGASAPSPSPSPVTGEGPSGQIAACSTRRLGSVTSCYRFAVTQHKMRRRPLESVSSRSLSVRGSWGTAPSVFWFLLYEQKERPGGEPHRLCTLQNQRDADRRLQTWPPPGRRTGRHPPVTPRRRRRPQT